MVCTQVSSIAITPPSDLPTDCIQSAVATCVLGTDVPVGVVNECAYRFLIPTEKLLANPITKALFDEDKATFHVASDPSRRLVWYPCRR
jgi:salicylate hydroxylase